jgi:lipopolysaccharide assembly outer membrane protein LptD (OstA)
MSKEVWKLSKLLRGVLPVFPCVFFLLTQQNLSADAYLAEDRVYYGADSYNINYKDEIINAKGNAYFRKGNMSVRADRIVIYYGENEKRANFFDNVKMIDTESMHSLRGDYGEGYFRDETYILTGNVEFFDETRKITGQRAETRGLEKISITENVSYSDDDIVVTSQRLDLWKDEKALFQDNVHAVFTEMGDEVFCQRLTTFFENGNQDFRDDVLYIQRERTGGERDPFVIRADLIQYDSGEEYFLLMDGVFATDGTYSLSGALVKYFRNTEILESIGNTVINDGQRTVYCDSAVLDVPRGDVSFVGAIQGVFNVE